MKSRRLGTLLTGLALLLMATQARAGGLDDAKLGLAELVHGNFEKAVFYNTRAIASGELERESLAISYYNRASGYLKLSQSDRAREDFKKAYETWPEHPMTRQKARELGFLD